MGVAGMTSGFVCVGGSGGVCRSRMAWFGMRGEVRDLQVLGEDGGRKRVVEVGGLPNSASGLCY